MATLLRCFSQGVKVCFEIVVMATDGGLVTAFEATPGKRDPLQTP